MVSDLKQEELKKILQENYPQLTIQEIAEKFGMKRSAFYWRMRKAGIHLGKAMVKYGESIEVSKD